jgi:hypothetical protein
VKPVIFYKNKSLRQYENEAAAEAIKDAATKNGDWEGPTNPAGVVRWRDALMVCRYIYIHTHTHHTYYVCVCNIYIYIYIYIYIVHIYTYIY